MIDKAILLKPHLAEEVVELEGLGAVRVRALSRAEMLRLKRFILDQGPEAGEVYVVAHGLVEPALSEDEARAFLEGHSGPVSEAIVDAVMALSGIDEGATKSG